MQQNNEIRKLINDKIYELQRFGKADSKPRRYVGGSQVGKPCARALWYAVHWASYPKQDPRILRLFDRGHEEEKRFVAMLRLIGCEVQEYDPDTIPILWYHADSDAYFVTMPNDPKNGENAIHCDDVSDTWHVYRAASRGVEIPEPKQFSWQDYDGHHKGNCDGRARFVPGVEKFGVRFDEWIGLEFKTHGDKSFCNLVRDNSGGVYEQKKEHYAQMTRYMNYMGWPLMLYNASNKNDDDISFEFVRPDNSQKEKHDEKVRLALYEPKPPRRLNENPSWFDCKYCDWRKHCHYGEPLVKNCRTCVMSAPVANGAWHCFQWNKDIPRDAEAAGCPRWIMRTD